MENKNHRGYKLEKIQRNGVVYYDAYNGKNTHRIKKLSELDYLIDNKLDAYYPKEIKKETTSSDILNMFFGKQVTKVIQDLQKEVV